VRRATSRTDHKQITAAALTPIRQMNFEAEKRVAVIKQIELVAHDATSARRRRYETSMGTLSLLVWPCHARPPNTSAWTTWRGPKMSMLECRFALCSPLKLLRFSGGYVTRRVLGIGTTILSSFPLRTCSARCACILHLVEQ
jgi:hypothetical protein